MRRARYLWTVKRKLIEVMEKVLRLALKRVRRQRSERGEILGRDIGCLKGKVEKGEMSCN